MGVSDNPQRPSERAIPHWLHPERYRLEITRGTESSVTDNAGNQYLDFTSQLYCVNAGHGNQAITSAIADQLERIQYVSPAKNNDTRNQLADEIAAVAPDALNSVLFSVTGSEANEIATQIAREHTGGQKVLTRWRSYHGSTYGAAGLTGDPETRTAVEAHAAVTGTTKFLPPVSYRSPFSADSPSELADQAASHLEYVIRNEGPDSIAAILMEPIGGTSGAFPAPPGYFEQVRELCTDYDILLIADEVITGFGRCGDWFGIQTEAVQPDLLTFAKAVTSAYVPLAGVIVNDEIAGRIRRDGLDVGQTFAGHPVACAAGLAALSEYRDGLLENVAELEPHFESELQSLEARHPAIGDVRGRGFLWGIEFTNPETGEPFFHPWTESGTNPVDTVIAEAQDRGVLVGSGRPGYQVILAPPFCTKRDEIDEAVAVLSEAVETVFGN